MSVNKWLGIGFLGKDPEIKFLEGGNAVCKFSLAMSEKWTDKNGEKKEHTEWVNIEAWGKLAEIAAEYLKKGSQCFIEGKIKTDKYDKDGETRYSTKVVAHSIQFLDRKGEAEKEKVKGDEDHIPF